MILTGTIQLMGMSSKKCRIKQREKRWRIWTKLFEVTMQELPQLKQRISLDIIREMKLNLTDGLKLPLSMINTYVQRIRPMVKSKT